MLPPGKINGRTTNESVVKARREPFTPRTAPSCRCSSMSFENAGIKIFSMSWWVRRPPPPCARTMRSSATRGTGQLRLNELVLASAIVVVGRARSLGGNHRRAQRIFRRALHRKSGTLVGLLDALQDQSADALGRFARWLTRKWEAEVGIVLLKASAKLESTGGNFSQPAPLPRADLEHFCDSFLCRTISFPPDGACVLILHLMAP